METFVRKGPTIKDVKVAVVYQACTWRAQCCVIGGAVHPGVPEHDVGAVVQDASAVPQPPDRVKDDVVAVSDLTS